MQKEEAMTAQSKSENEKIALRICKDNHFNNFIPIKEALDAKDAKIAELEGKVAKLESYDKSVYVDGGLIFAPCNKCASLQQLLGKCKEALALCDKNDKTRYDYRGATEIMADRYGNLPERGARFNTPSEIAKELLTLLEKEGL